MRRRPHQLAYVQPVVPDVCPWPMRFQMFIYGENHLRTYTGHWSGTG